MVTSTAHGSLPRVRAVSVGADLWDRGPHLPFHRIIEYLTLEGTHKDHRVQLPAPRRTT